MSTTPRPDPAWDSFWRYDRLSSFQSAPGAGNYGPAIAGGWREFFASLPNGSRILDLATGNGAIAVIAVEAGKAFRVTGADLADVSPTAFVSHNRSELGQIAFFPNTPLEALPFPDGGFDAVVSQFGIEYSDLGRSLPEAVRVLSSGGRLRFVLHASEGAVARNAIASLADADFLLKLDLVRMASQAQLDIGAFNAGLRKIADHARNAVDIAMIANVHRTLCETSDHRPLELVKTAEHLRNEIAAHRSRQAALLAAALTRSQAESLGKSLQSLGLDEIFLGEQRDGSDLIGYIIEARRPSAGAAADPPQMLSS